MRLHAGCEIVFESTALTPAIFMLRPRSGMGQWVIGEEYELDPSVSVTEYTDTYGNLCQRLVAPVGTFRLKSSARVETADRIDVAAGTPFIPVQDLPDMTLQFLLPSRYCQADRLSNLALEIAGNATPGYDQVEAIRSWIHSHIKYEYGTSDASTSAVETAEHRVGVCRDFTHLGIALCRSLSIPARMVVGYLYELDPMDLHAWFEAFVGVQDTPTEGRWYTFDATQPQPKGNRIAVAYGRDAADVAFVTQFGPMTLKQMSVWVSADS